MLLVSKKLILLTRGSTSVVVLHRATKFPRSIFQGNHKGAATSSIFFLPMSFKKNNHWAKTEDENQDYALQPQARSASTN